MKNRMFLLLFFGLFLFTSCGGDQPKNDKPTPAKVDTKKTETPKEKPAEEVKQPETTPAKEVAKPKASPEQLAEAQKIIEKVSDDALAKLDGKKLFRTNCANCHGFKGDMGVNGATDLTTTKVSLQDAVAQVYFGRGMMTPFKKVLEEEEIVAVSKFVETLRK